MVNCDYIAREVQRIKRKYGENDPARLAQEMGIIVEYEPMGTYDGCCKGFFITHRRKKHITINSDLPEPIRRIILIHEIAHAVLHWKSGSCAAFHDFGLFDTADQKEYEANIFAADFLMSDEDVLELLNEDISFFGAAAKLYVPAEMLDFKFRLIKRRGYELIEAPITSTGDFLKDIDLDGGISYD